jgi:Mrp family chromosome partitioning ATPase
MTSDGGAEALKAAIRRSLLLIIALVVVAIVTVNALRQMSGPTYSASARVLISTTPLSQIITNTVPPFIDPNRVLDTAQTLANSPEVYERAARDTQGRLGTASKLQAATSVSGSGTNDILTFSAKSSHPSSALAIANATSTAYVEWRADFAQETIRKTADQLRSRLEALSPTDPGRRDIQNLLTKLDGLSAPGDATVVAPASSTAKVSPAPVKDTLLGASLGLVIALLFVALREALDTTIRSERDVEEILAVPVIGTVRTLPRRAQMVTYGRHGNSFADSYALLAANLARIRPQNESVVLAVTSSVSGEGKTTTAANLAVSLARRGSRVVLADFDLRRPALGKLFGLAPDAPGVLQILTGKASVDETLWSVTLDGSRPGVSQNGRPLGDAATTQESETKGSSLMVIPAGGTHRSLSGPLVRRVAPVLEQLRLRADFVVIDTPPAFLTVELAELSGLIDNVLIVVRHGRVSQRSLRLLGQQARSWPAAVAGAVLTGAPPSEKKYAYYGTAG